MSTPSHNPSQSPTLLWSAGALGIIATTVGAVLPVLVGVWQAQLGLSVDQAGFVAATELLGQVVGTSAFILAAREWSLRTIAALALIVMVGGNLASAGSFNLASLIVTRAISGTGGGLARALCMMCLAKALSPGRAFAVYAAAQVALAAAVTALMPQLVSRFGPRSPFVVISAISAFGLALCSLLPKDPTEPRSASRRAFTSISRPSLLAIGGLFLYFLGQGALWTYLEPIGRNQSIPSTGISRALALLNVAGLVGALGVGALAHRLRPRVVLIILLAMGMLSVVGLFNASSSGFFIASACGFYFTWCASFPFQFTLISKTDSTGRASSMVPAVDGLGLASGAAFAGTVLPMLGLAVTGWIYAVASVCGVACYVIASMMPKTEDHPPLRPVPVDVPMQET
jgi:predicted MFS family arabinose efflux permease